MRNTQPRDIEVYETLMRKYRKWREIVIEQLAADRAAAFDYIQFTMEEHQVDGDTAVFLLALRTFVESQGGITELSKKTGVNREVFSKVLSSEEPPRLDMLVTILSALGANFQLNRWDPRVFVEKRKIWMLC